MDELTKTEWYERLVFDVKQLAVKGVVATKHAIGKRILKDEAKLGKAKYGDRRIETLADDLDVDRTDLYRCVLFARKYPELSTAVNNLSWRAIRKLLPDKPKTVHVSHNSGENEWYTPPKFIEAAREVMGKIDTDPASSKTANKTVKAETFYSEKDDGLEQEWGKTVWINPPYSQPEISLFCEALLQKLESGEVKKACALVNNATETVFGQNLLKTCDAVCFPSGRVKFLDMQGDAKGAPLQGQMIVYFGSGADKFCREFAEFGVCLHG